MSREAQWPQETLTTVSSASKGAPHLGQARTMASGPEGPLSSLGGARRATRSGMAAGSYSNCLRTDAAGGRLTPGRHHRETLPPDRQPFFQRLAEPLGRLEQRRPPAPGRRIAVALDAGRVFHL